MFKFASSVGVILFLKLQQAEVIRDRTGYRVGHYCGEMGQDFWDSRKWQREFDSKQAILLLLHFLLHCRCYFIAVYDVLWPNSLLNIFLNQSIILERDFSIYSYLLY